MKVSESRREPRTAFVASFPPRECGIATFTSDLANALPGQWSVIAMDEPGSSRAYGPEVRRRIARDDLRQYVQAAEWVNRSDIDLINLQHEFGLFGGPRGEYLLSFLDRVQRPVLTTLHTVLPSPDDLTRRVTRKLIERSSAVVVQTQTALGLLRRYYGSWGDKIAVIPHGIPTIPYGSARRQSAKDQLGLTGRTVLATFGLINPGKGIEYALRALPEIVEQNPDLVYLVVGETHPGIRSQSGESYRRSLEALTRELGVDDQVRFINRYLTLPEVVDFLAATDVYLMPYLEPNQIVSGTLAYALGAGRPVVATPFTYAREVLADGRGCLVPFRDSEAIGQTVLHLMDDEAYRMQMEARAYAYTRDWLWPEVGRRYQALSESLDNARLKAAQAAAARTPSRPVPAVRP